MSEKHSINVLSGPFGSLLNDLYGITTQQAFASGNIDAIRTALREYQKNGVTQPVTPTYGAAVRGPHAKPEEFTSDLARWNTEASFLTMNVFGNDSHPLGSVASILRNKADNVAWQLLPDKITRAMAIHRQQIEALCNGGIHEILGEAFYDFNDAVGLVLAAARTGIKRVIVSFEPKGENGLPNDFEHTLLVSYWDVLDRLRDASGGKTNVEIGLNCGGTDEIAKHIDDEPHGTFSVAYPNQCAPSKENRERFEELAHKNNNRTLQENIEFAELRKMSVIRDSQLDHILQICKESGVKNFGLCCGSSPTYTNSIAKKIAAL